MSIKKLDYLLKGMGFLATANGKATVVSPDLSSQHLRVLAEIGLADCYYHPYNSETVLVRRRLDSFPYGFHIISENEVFSTMKEKEISKLEKYAGGFSDWFLPIDRKDLQHFQALSKMLSPEKLVSYLEAEAGSSLGKKQENVFLEFNDEESKGLIGNFLVKLGKIIYRVSSQRKYKNLIDAIAQIEGTERDVSMLQDVKKNILVFTGTLLAESTFPFRGLAGQLALEEVKVPVEIIAGPDFAIPFHPVKTKPFNWYFNRTYTLCDGNTVTLKLTERNTSRNNGTAHINPKEIKTSAELLYHLAEEGDEVSPILSEPAIIMLSQAYKQIPDLGLLLCLNRVLMYRGAYKRATTILEDQRTAFEDVDSTIKSDFFLYLADAYFRQGELGKAEEAIQASIHINPRNNVAYFLSGAVNQVKGDYAMAEKDLEKSLELRPGDEITRKFLDRTRRVQGLL